jgi:DNA-binding NarL/FixJ family response regulator
MSIKVIIADDHKVFREGLRSLLEKERNIDIVAEASDGREAVRMSHELSPDLIIMDIGMPDLNGIEATRQIISYDPDVKVLALSMHLNIQYVISVLRAGASGYLLKDCAFEELVQAIQSVLRKKKYLSPEITDMMVSEFLNEFPKEDSPVFSVLTERQREVLQLIAEGKTTKEIASLLNVSLKTIETHRQHIMNKLNIRSIAQLTKFAVREGLTSLDY